jgi:hypothetical protein
MMPFYKRTAEPPSYWQETAPTLTLSSPLPAQTDVAVIGGGLLGTATCYWLAKAGITVLLPNAITRFYGKLVIRLWIIRAEEKKVRALFYERTTDKLLYVS